MLKLRKVIYMYVFQLKMINYVHCSENVGVMTRLCSLSNVIVQSNLILIHPFCEGQSII